MELNCRETERPFGGIYELDVRGGRIKLPRTFLGVWMECAEYVVCMQQGVRIMKVSEAGIAADMAGARPQAGMTIVESGSAQIDRYGRLLVPQSFACQAGNGEMTVAVVGLNSHIEIWEIGAYRAMEDAQEKDFDFLNALLEDGK